tara:strand:+ start:73 stop:399 length:327 start_codon:yes stop_codon:yes gene_type:complete
MDFSNIIERIITLNHAWKLARDEFGAKHSITESLRLQKSSWQATLLRDFPKVCFLHKDDENVDGEPLLSVRLVKPTLINGVMRHDAEHMPERIAKDLFHVTELESLIR